MTQFIRGERPLSQRQIAAIARIRAHKEREHRALRAEHAKLPPLATAFGLMVLTEFVLTFGVVWVISPGDMPEYMLWLKSTVVLTAIIAMHALGEKLRSMTRPESVLRAITSFGTPLLPMAFGGVYGVATYFEASKELARMAPGSGKFGTYSPSWLTDLVAASADGMALALGIGTMLFFGITAYAAHVTLRKICDIWARTGTSWGNARLARGYEKRLNTLNARWAAFEEQKVEALRKAESLAEAADVAIEDIEDELIGPERLLLERQLAGNEAGPLSITRSLPDQAARWPEEALEARVDAIRAKATREYIVPLIRKALPAES